MTAESTQTAPRSRRALLAGAIGGLGVWAASAIGRAAPAEAAAGDPIRMGQVNGAARTTTTLRSRTKEAAAFAVRQFGQGPAISGVNARPQGINAVGVYGASDGLQSTGVVGSGTSSPGCSARAGPLAFWAPQCAASGSEAGRTPGPPCLPMRPTATP